MAVQLKTLNGYAFNASALGGKVPEYYLSPRNLLDNSDFTNPVNQRNFQSGNTVGAYSYFIDRWMTAEEQVITLSGDGLGLKSNKRIYQSTEGIKSGTVMTLAAYLSNGKTITLSYEVSYNSDGSWLGINSLEAEGIQLIAETYGGMLRSVIYAVNATTVKWAALYEGTYTADTLPPYVPKGYAVELAECQRYYYRSWVESTLEEAKTVDRGWIAVTTPSYYGATPILALPQTMRIIPTIKVYSKDTLSEGYVAEWSGTGDIKVDYITRQTKNHFGLGFNGQAVINKYYCFFYEANADL